MTRVVCLVASASQQFHSDLACRIAGPSVGALSHHVGFVGVDGSEPDVGTLPGPHVLAGSAGATSSLPRSPVVLLPKNFTVPSDTCTPLVFGVGPRTLPSVKSNLPAAICHST